MWISNVSQQLIYNSDQRHFIICKNNYWPNVCFACEGAYICFRSAFKRNRNTLQLEYESWRAETIVIIKMIMFDNVQHSVIDISESASDLSVKMCIRDRRLATAANWWRGEDVYKRQWQNHSHVMNVNM